MWFYEVPFDINFKTECRLFIQHLALDNDRCISGNVGKTKITWLRGITCTFYNLDYDVNIDLPI